MATLPPGVTRYERAQQGHARTGPGQLVPVVMAVAASTGFAIWLDHGDPLTVGVIATVCVLTPPATLPFPWWLRGVVIVAAGVGSLAWTNNQGFYGFGYALTWGVCTVAGTALLMMVLSRRRFQQRMSSAEGAPASGLDPSGDQDVGVLAVWRDADYDYEAVGPDVEVVLDAVRALNGHGRSIVSIFHGRGRMDVGGSATSRMVVLQSDNRRKWHMVADPAQAEGEVSVAIAEAQGRYPARNTTTLRDAERAVRVWLERGERDPGLQWWSDSAWTEPYRPPSLKATD